MTKNEIAKALGRQSAVEEWDPKSSPVHRRVIDTFPRELAVRHRVFPVAMQRNNIGVTWFVATTDPTDEALRNALGSALCTPDEPVVITWFIATAAAIEKAIMEHYSSAELQPPEEPILLLEEVVEEVVEEVETKPRTLLARIRFAKKGSPSS